MRTNKKNRLMRLFQACLVVFFLLLVIACNDTMIDTLRYDYPESTANRESGHVLMIILDGASGRAIQTARNAYKTPILKAMLEHSLYTDYGLGDNTAEVGMGKMSNARGWANLMVGNTKHGVKDEQDLENVSDDHLIARLIDNNSNVSLYAADETFRQCFNVSKVNAPQVNSDEDVKNKVVEELGNTLSIPADVVIAEFNGVQKVGKENNKFYEDNGISTIDIINAIQILDGYVGEMMETLEARPHFASENWLVIVTSNYGGELTSETESDDYYTDPTRNTFTLVYNKRVLPQVQGRPSDASIHYSYHTPVWGYDYRYPEPTGYAESAGLKGNTSLGSLTWGEQMTLMFFILVDEKNENQGKAASYAIMSKSAAVNKNGWMLCFSNNGKIRFYFGNSNFLTTDDYINDRCWHSFALTFELDAAKKNLVMNYYLDGKPSGSKTYSESKYKKNYQPDDVKNIPLRIGSTYNRESQNLNGGTKTVTYKNSFSISNIQIYDVALPADDIAKYAGKNMLHELKESYPYWDNLKGYWPCDLEEDELSPVLKDYSQYRVGDNTDFIIDRGDKGAWTNGQVDHPAMHPIPASDKFYYYKTFNTVDISRQVLLWLGKNIKWDWNMEGKAWTLTYSEMESVGN